MWWLPSFWAKLKTDDCFIGELGVCYGISDFEGQKVYDFVFETGRFIVLTSDDAAQALNITGRICDAVADYVYASDAQLKTDFRASRFSAAFPSHGGGCTNPLESFVRACFDLKVRHHRSLILIDF